MCDCKDKIEEIISKWKTDSDYVLEMMQDIQAHYRYIPEECLLVDDSEDKNDLLKQLGFGYEKINSTKELKDLISLFLSQPIGNSR